MEKKEPTRQQLESLTIKTLYESNVKRLQLKIINSEYDLSRTIRDGELHRPGLALSGFTDVFTYWRVQILGRTEISYLLKLSPKERLQRLRSILGFDIPCLIVTNNFKPPSELLQVADEMKIPVFNSALTTTWCVHRLGEYMDFKFAPFAYVLGSLVDVWGIGSLIIGRSGIGKSEVALDLVERGHRLVADDVVIVRQHSAGILMGRAKKLLSNYMEIRGVGLLDIRRLYGIHSIRAQKRIEVVIQLEDWKKGENYDRTGLEERNHQILDTKVPLVRLPIYPGKNITVIVETIALNMILRVFGENPAQELNQKLIKQMNADEKNKKLREDLLIGDYE